MLAYQIFLICAGCGAVSGIVYDFLYLIRSIICGMPAMVITVKDKIFTCISDIIYFACLAALYIYCSVKFNFPDFRLYMLAAVFLGFIIYLNSFHKIIKLSVNVVYRKIYKKRSNPVR